MVKSGSVLILAAAVGQLWTFSAGAHPEYPVHILPDDDGSQIQHLMSVQPQLFAVETPLALDIIDRALNVGARNLEWIKFMNASRPVTEQISLSDPANTMAYPITQPNRYSPARIQQAWDLLYAEMPRVVRDVVFDNAPFTMEPPLPVEDYKSWARRVDRLYQIAARWRALSVHKSWYAANRKGDIRGYYFLSPVTDLKSRLENWRGLPAETQSEYREWLLTMCWNSLGFTESCKRSLDVAIGEGRVYDFYARYFVKSKEIYEDYFRIFNARTDLRWPEHRPELTEVPFRDPLDAAVRRYLTDNLHDEWRWSNWRLNLVFSADARVEIRFEPNAVPNVNRLGGDIITMNANAPLTEYDVQWTIRHEFGHVLGLPDCYVEFFDTEAKEFVNYQIDVTNLMCSRRGKIKKIHYDVMREYYLGRLGEET